MMSGGGGGGAPTTGPGGGTVTAPATPAGLGVFARRAPAIASCASAKAVGAVPTCRKELLAATKNQSFENSATTSQPARARTSAPDLSHLMRECGPGDLMRVH